MCSKKNFFAHSFAFSPASQKDALSDIQERQGKDSVKKLRK